MHPNVDVVHVLELGIVLLDPRKDGGVGDAVHFPSHLRDMIAFLDGAHDHRRRLGEGWCLRRYGEGCEFGGLRREQWGAGRSRWTAVTHPRWGLLGRKRPREEREGVGRRDTGQVELR